MMKAQFAALLLAAALATAAAQPVPPPAEEQALQAVQLSAVASLGPATEAPSAPLPAGRAAGAGEVSSLGQSFKVRLQPAAGVTNSDNTYAVFEYWPRANDRMFWKLTIFDIRNFSGAQ